MKFFFYIEYAIIEAEELCLCETTELKQMIMQKHLYSTDDRNIMIIQLIQWIDLRSQVIIFYFLFKKKVLIIFLFVKFDNVVTDDKKIRAFCKRIDIPYIINKGRSYYLFWLGEKIKQTTTVALQMLEQPRILLSENVTIILKF